MSHSKDAKKEKKKPKADKNQTNRKKGIVERINEKTGK
jgi:hypothetical protein